MTTDPTRVPEDREAVAAALASVVDDLGSDVVESPERLRAALSDALGAHSRDHRSSVDALVVAAEEGIALRLQENSVDVTSLSSGLVARGLTPGLSTWAVKALQRALADALLPQATIRRADLFAAAPRDQSAAADPSGASASRIPTGGAPSMAMSSPPGPNRSPAPAPPLVARAAESRLVVPVLVILLMVAIGLLVLTSAADAALLLPAASAGR